MSIERTALEEMFSSVERWLFLLPTDVQRKVRFARVAYAGGGSASPEMFAAEVGGRNWVLARRTPRIVERYGNDVICLSKKQYEAAEMAALQKEAELR